MINRMVLLICQRLEWLKRPAMTVERARLSAAKRGQLAMR
jgi:hypothetical protein